MSGDFIASNVFLYTLDAANPRKQEIASAILNEALQGTSATISFQVVQEVLNGATKKVSPVMSRGDLDLFFENFLAPLWRVVPTQALYRRALDLRDRYRYGFYDSLILAAALEAGCTRLLTEDLQHGQTIDGLRIENPFV